MDPVLTRCGYRCDLCLAYRPNVEKSPPNQQILSDGWFTYFGFRIDPSAILCDGCMVDRGRLIDQTCQVRSCVIERGVPNCAHCLDYVCEKLKERIVESSEIEHRLGAKIPIEDYHRFILPYENKRRLDVFRLTGVIIE